MGIGTVSDRIPEPSVTRLATYLHVLRALGQRGVLVASSGQLATAAGVNPAILRKDLSHVGANGVRGVGYDVGRLTARIALALHTDTVHTVALVGAGTLGRLLVTHTATDRAFRVVAMFDDDPDVIVRAASARAVFYRALVPAAVSAQPDLTSSVASASE